MMSRSFKKHDVFLNFRGEDTRKNFISHLYTALSQRSIKTYIDYLLDRGENVWPALAKAIEESHVSVVVFSENYATSKWCLEELVKILECRKDQGQVVIPVFYETDPSHIRYQTGSYEKAFAKYEPDLGDRDSESNKQKVLKWKAALTEAANISGWDSRIHKDESHLIERIIDDVLTKLHLRYPTELKGLVGTEIICGTVELLIKTFRVIGIWGMGGIGKSTIAKVLFAKLFPQYDNVCFVANAKEYSPDKLFSELLKKNSKSPLGESSFNIKMLSNKKVFVVLDNVDSLDQLEYLCREFSDLSDDSRLIITTRHRQLLYERVDWIYEVNKWESPESLKLFSLEAFKESHPQKGYEDLSQKAVDYAGGLPLALKVLGSHLRLKGTDFWESTFRKLHVYPNEIIQKLLEVSYDGLEYLEQKIFLDIAFFFKGVTVDHVKRILDASGFEASSGIEVLEDKALITISNSNTIQIHELLQKMGLEIVRKECGVDPGKRTRLRHSEAREVIAGNKGTDSIEGITLDLSQVKDLPLCADTFSKMKTLRFLKFYGQSSSDTYFHLPAVLEPFSDKLRYFEWIGYPFKHLPSPFCAKLLVEIRMPHSNVKELWKGKQELGNLEGIDLSECKEFACLPDLSEASRLKWVNLSSCESLRALHPSVLSSDTLATLILDRCENLTSVKAGKHLKSLEKISVNGCSGLKEFAVSSDLIENLDLSNTGIQTLDASIGGLHNLKWLNLEGLRIRHLLKELSCLKSLKELKLSDSELVIDKQQLHVLFDGLRSLQILHLKDCSHLFEVPANISVLSHLQELRLDRSNVNRLPDSIKHLQELEILSLENCRVLLCLPELPPFVKQLRAINCTQLVSVSNLKTLATKMIGKDKHISFKNCLKLDADSLHAVEKSLHLTMASAVFHNVVVRRLRSSYNYTSIEICLPGSRVPSQFEYRTAESSITIQLPNRSNLLGFIYSVVLSPAGGNGIKKHGDGTKIKCQCYLAQGTKDTWLYSDTMMTELNSDHVCAWYDPLHCDSILKFYEPKVCFEFSVANDSGEADDDSICIRECGIRLVSVSELQSILPQLDLDSDKKKDLKKGVELESGRSTTNLTSIASDLSEENNGGTYQMQYQKWYMSSSSSIFDSNRPNAAEEGVKSTRYTELGREQFSFIESTNVVKSRGIEGTPSESDFGFYAPVVVSVDEENASKDKSYENNYDMWDDIEETKHTEENPTLQGGQIIVSDMNIKEPFQQKENELLDLGKPEEGEEDGSAEEDLFAELESILLGSPKTLSKATCYTSEVAIREVLHNLECLLMENSLESILGDMELQQKLHLSLDCIKQASGGKIPPHIVKLVESMKFSMEDLFKEFSLTQKVVEDHISRVQQKERFVQRMTDGRKQKELVVKEKSQCEDETKCLDEETKKLDEEIRLLVEQKETVELKKGKLKKTMERCDGEKKKLEDEAKNMIPESRELVSAIQHSKSSYAAALSKKHRLNDKWEGFRKAYADNSETSEKR